MIRQVGWVVGLAALSGCQAPIAPKPETPAPPLNKPEATAPTLNKPEASSEPAPALLAPPPPSAEASTTPVSSSTGQVKPTPRPGAKGQDVRPVTPGALRD